jgi:nucleoid DNA-binding protein
MEEKEVIGYQGLPTVYKQMYGGTLPEADKAIRQTVAVIAKCLEDGMTVQFLNLFSLSVTERKGSNVKVPTKPDLVSYSSKKRLKVTTGKTLMENLNN